MISPIEFAIVCHGGPLEIQALLCLKSLILFQKNIAGIKVFVPQGLPQISEPTRAFMLRYGAHFVGFSNEFLEEVADPFVPENKRFLVANKIWCFENLEPEVPRILLDCDVLLLSDLTDIFSSVSADIAASPTFIETLGPQPTRLLKALEIPPPTKKIRTRLTGEPIFPYFNGGFVMARNTRRLFDSWLKTYRDLMSRPDLVGNLYHTDQVSLSMAILKEGYSFELWPQSINVPLGFLDYRPAMKAVHWFNLEVLRQQHSLVPEFQKRIALIVHSLRDQDGIDLSKVILRAPKSFWRRFPHKMRELARRTKWRIRSIGYWCLPSLS